MTNVRSTKRALWMSVVSLMLCFAMLLGTTYAWFTDSVTSQNNVIMSGNLDIELEYWNGEKWATVEEASDILTNTLWEPGVTEVAYLRIANAGSLALKYQFGINIVSETAGINVDGDEFLLSDYILFGVVEDVNGETGAYATRDAAVADIANADKISAGFTKAETMLSGDELYLALVVYMPTTVGNEANHNGTNVPEINLGINIFATQAESEEDGFGTDYDADAWMPEMQVYTAEDLQAALNNAVAGAEIVLMDNVVTTEPIVVPATATTFSMRSGRSAVVIDLNGKNISLSEDKITTTYAIVNMGNLILMDSVGGGSVNSRGIYNGYNIETGEAVPEATLTVVNGVYNALGTDGGAAIFNYGSVTIEGGTFTSVGGYSLNNRENASMIIEDATVTGGIYNMGTVVIENGNISTNRGGYTHAIYSSGGSIEINGGNFSGNGNEVINANSDVAIINGGTFEKVGKTSYLLAGSNMVINNGTFNAYSENGVDPAAHPVRPDVTVNGGTFNYQHTNIAAGNSIVESNGSYVVLPSATVEKIADGFYFDGENTYYITNAVGFAAFAAEVNKGAEYEGNTFAGKTVLLMADVDFEGAEWNPIGSFGNTSKQFCGVFDGQGHTVSNFKITKKAADREGKNRSSNGFFGNVNGTIKNLTVAKAHVEITNDGRFVGALIGRLNGGLVENCKVVDTYVEGSVWQIGAIVGQANAGTIQNCVVENTTVVGKAGGVAAVAGFQVDAKELTINNCTVKNCEIKQSVESYGGNYDAMFATIIGCVNNTNGIVNVAGCTVEKTTVKGVESSVAVGYIVAGASVTVDGVKLITTAEELKAALNVGGTVVLGADIAVIENIAVSNSNFVLDGNGYTITGACSIAVLDINNCTATVKNVVFDGIQGGSAIRTVNTKFYASDVTVKNCVQNQNLQGLFRLLGENTVENCTFVNNTCNIAVSLNYDNDFAAPQVVNGCVFEKNTCSVNAVLYYVDGTSFTANGNKFLNNTVITTGNAATVYVGFMENATITNNLFQGNDVTGTTKRVSGGLMIGYAATITGNAFIDNTVTGSIEGLGNDVCASVYYTDIDLSGNYWGGNAPVLGDDYYQEYTNYSVIINDYLTTYAD